jgi:hypothetical protein
MNVRNITNNKGREVANQFILSEGYLKVFQSYQSTICHIALDKLVLNGNMWDYSNTTRKYFKQFINEETRFHYENKAQWLKEIQNNKDIEVI